MTPPAPLPAAAGDDASEYRSWSRETRRWTGGAAALLHQVTESHADGRSVDELVRDMEANGIAFELVSSVKSSRGNSGGGGGGGSGGGWLLGRPPVKPLNWTAQLELAAAIPAIRGQAPRRAGPATTTTCSVPTL